MAEMKYLNTRIQLKYDTLAQWQEKNPTLLTGELAIVSLGNSHTTTTPDNGTHPILFKVGPGAFNSLPFASALAADVYGWAKKETPDWNDFATIPVSKLPEEAIDTNDNTTYAFAIVEGKLQVTETPHSKGVAGTPVVKSYDFVTPAELAEELKNYYTKSEVDKLIEDVEALIPTIPDVTATGDNEVILSAEGHHVTGSHAAHAAGNADTASTQAISGYGATGSIVIPKLVTNAAGHVTAISEETVSITLPNEQVFVDTNTAHTHTAGDGLKLTGNGGIDGVVDYSLNLALKLENGSIILHDGDDATKVIATLEADELLEDSYLNDVEIVGNELQFTWKMDDGSTKTDSVDLKHLVDVYKGSDGETINLDVNEYTISAEVATQSLRNIHIAVDADIAEAKLSQDVQDALALARTALQEHQSLDNYKTKQNAYSAEGSTVKTVTGVTQNANGEVNVTFEEIAFPAPPVVNDGKFTVSGTGALTGSGEMTANQAGDTTATLDIADKGVTTAKIADHAVGAAQIKAEKDYKGEDAEVWVFYCGTSSILV